MVEFRLQIIYFTHEEEVKYDEATKSYTKRFLFISNDKTNTSLAELRETCITTVSASIIQ